MAKTSKQGYIEHIDAHVGPGEFVLFDNTVGRVLDVAASLSDITPAHVRPTGAPNDGCFFHIQHYKTFGEAGVEPEVHLDPYAYSNVTDEIDEVFASLTEEWVHCSRVSCIAFVFHVESINEQTYACNGISNAFCIQFKQDPGNDELVAHGVREHLPFPRKSYSARIWLFLQSVHLECRKVFSGPRRYLYKSETIKLLNVNPECHDYVLCRMRDGSDTIFTHDGKRKTTRRFLVPGFGLQAFRRD